ncbi:MAG TPA: type II secretion system protein GspJ [Tepidisphaeraceae bacterium]|nr:type II secretion system protein GspJ [Tepidisphaeraceae bacterium]
MLEPHPQFVSGHARRTAFTLLELIVSLAIAATVAASMLASLAIAFKSRQSAERVVGTARTQEVAMDIMREDLLCALPPRGQFAGSFEATDSQDDRGYDADDLIFYTTTASPFHPEGANGEIKQMELTVYQPQGSTDYVLVRRSLNNALAPVQENPDEEILCRHVLGFNLRYFDGTAWQDSWDSTQLNNTLPAAIEVTLSIDTLELDGDGKPRVSTTVRIFPFPCTGLSPDAASTSTSGTSTTGGG